MHPVKKSPINSGTILFGNSRTIVTETNSKIIILCVVRALRSEPPSTGVAGPSEPAISTRSFRGLQTGAPESQKMTHKSENGTSSSRFGAFFAFLGYFRAPFCRPFLRLLCDFWLGGPGDSRRWRLGSQTMMRAKRSREHHKHCRHKNYLVWKFQLCPALEQKTKAHTLRAQILKIFKILKFSSELEIFKRATHQTPIFVGNSGGQD